MQKLKQILLITILLISCKSIDNKLIPTKPATLLFEMNKGGCYGTCPIYSLSLYENRLVKYNGKRFTENQGVHQWHLSKKDFEEIKSIISEKFNSDYTHNLEVQDLPQTSLNIKNTYQIKFKGSCPKAFRSELKQIKSLLMKNASWK